jgi:hypothetical protein
MAVSVTAALAAPMNFRREMGGVFMGIGGSIRPCGARVFYLLKTLHGLFEKHFGSIALPLGFLRGTAEDGCPHIVILQLFRK